MMKKFLKCLLAFSMIFASFSTSVFAIESDYTEVEVIVNDATVGTELHQFNYSGTWKTSVNYPDRFYNGDEHWFNFARYYTAGDPLPYYEVKFEGIGIELYGETQPALGIYNIYIDNILHGTCDAYSVERVSKTKLYGVSGLAYGEHTLKVELTNTKNEASTGTDGEIDYVKVLGYREYANEQIITRIEDSVTTTTNEPFKIQYGGATWTYGNTHPELFSNADEHYTKTGASTGAYYEMYFTGTRVQVYGSVANNHGALKVTVDESTFDATGYAATKAHQQLIFDSGVLADGDHYLKVAYAGDASKAMQLDFIEVTHGPIAPTSIDIFQDDYTGFAGMQFQATATLTPSLASAAIEWSTSDDNVATVDASGLVTIVSEEAATCQLIAKVKDSELSDSINITVLPAVDGMKAFVSTTATTASQDDYVSFLQNQNLSTSFSDVAWRNDELLSSVVVCTVEELTNLKVEASDFTNGEITFSKDNIDIKWLKEVSARIGKGNTTSPTKQIADVIHKGGAINASAEDVLTAWINIKVPADCAPGTYTGTITVSADEVEEPTVLNYSFEVLDLLQPSSKDLGTTIQIWQHPFSVAEYYGVAEEDYFTEEHFKYLRASMKEYASIGGNDAVTNIVEEAWNHQCYYGDPSMVKWQQNADGTWTFDYTWFDAWVNFLIECGVVDPQTGYGRIKCYSIVPWGNYVTYKDANGDTVKNAYTPGTDAWKEIWTPFLEDFTDHVTEKGWFDITYISMDERAMSQIEASIDLIHTITNKDGESLMISSAFNTALTASYDVTDNIDDISIGQKHISHTTTVFRDLANHRRAKGLTTTVYTCTGDYPSNYTISDPIDNTWTMWNTLYQDADGFLRWAWDSWVEDPLTSVNYKSWEPGDGWFIYPVEKNTESDTYFYSTPRYEMFKQGIRDTNKARYLQNISDALYDEVEELINSLQRPAKGSSYSSATYASEADRQITITEAQRMRTSINEIAADYAENGTTMTTKKELREALAASVDAYNNPFIYTSESYERFKAAYENGIAVNEDDDATQENVDIAVSALNTAYEALVEITIPELATDNLINTSAQTNISVVDKTSECVTGGNPNEDGEASNLLDYDSATYWHTDYKNVIGMPQSITFDLKAQYDLSDITFLPRQGAKAPGSGDPLEVKLYAGTTKDNMQLIGYYTFETTGGVLANRDGYIRMYVNYDEPVQFVKWEVLKAGGNASDEYANAAEIRFYGTKYNKNVVYKDDLNALIAEVEALNEETYGIKSWTYLQNVLNAAKVVAEKEDAMQPEVDVVKNVLQSAKDALVDRSPLKAILDESDVIESQKDKYTPESFAVFKDAQMGASDAYTNPNLDLTQADIIMQMNLLREAIEQLEEVQYDPPQRPTNIATKEVTDTSFTVEWTPSTSDNVVKYVIYDWESGDVLYEGEECVATISNLTPDTHYSLGVKAVDDRGNESAGLPFGMLTLPEKLAPEAVSVLRADDTNYKTITLVWEAVEGATSYDVYRKSYKEDATFELEATVEETTYASTGVMTGKEYAFYVVAKNEVGEAQPSGIVSAATSLQGEVTLAMEQVSTSKFHLSWNKIDGATRYIVYRKRNDDKMKKVLTLGGDVFEYTTAEMPNGDYQFQVKAGRYDSTDRVMTKASNKVSGSVEALKPSVTATAGTKSAKISWKKMEGVTHYQVYRATSSGGKYTKLVTTKELSYTAKSLSAGKKYYFKVRGYKTYKSGTDIKYTVYTPYSSVKSVTAK